MFGKVQQTEFIEGGVNSNLEVFKEGGEFNSPKEEQDWKRLYNNIKALSVQIPSNDCSNLLCGEW